MLGAAQPDALGTEITRHLRVLRGFGVGAHLHAAHLVGPDHQRAEVADEFGKQGRNLARHHFAGRTDEGQDVALDRKSVVKGKGVSVRVDLGGRRTLTKKSTQYNTTTNTKSKQSQ